MGEQTTASAQFQQLLADHWEFWMQEDPLFATYTGDHRFNDRLPHVGEEDHVRQEEQLRAFRRQQEAIERAALTPGEQLNYDILARTLDNDIAELEFRNRMTCSMSWWRKSSRISPW